MRIQCNFEVRSQVVELRNKTILSLQPPCGSRNLWDLVLVLCEGDEHLLPVSYRKGIMHTKHLVKHKAVSCLSVSKLNIFARSLALFLFLSYVNVTDFRD